MNYGISGLSIIPVRREPSEKSEMVTQILFGECFEVFEMMVGWSRIKLAWDSYEGWVDTKMITPLNERAFRKLAKMPCAVTGDIINIVPTDNGQNLMLVAGSTLPVWRPYLKEFTIGKEKSASLNYLLPRRSNISTPYLWGGCPRLGLIAADHPDCL